MTGPARDEGLLVVADRLWDGTGVAVRRDVALAIRGSLVDRVAPVADCAGWTEPRLHVGGGTVMPGLMDRDIAGVVALLCSDQGGYVSGATIDVNGSLYFGP